MSNNIYPLKFHPIYKQMIWGGDKLRTVLNKSAAPEKTGESWEISGVEENVSVVSNGFLAGNQLDELIEVYMGDLVGDAVFDKYGTEFPVLIKFIHANDNLSVQVHPDDDFAAEHHGKRGKTEMWYIIEAEEGAELISGFKRDVDEKIFMQHLKERKLPEILNFEPVKAGDVFYLPAKRVHAINKGIVLTEIQQTSDVTYRIYDWDRVDKEGNARELHLEQALKVMDYKQRDDIRTRYDNIPNKTVNLADSPYFITGLIGFDQPVDKDFSLIDSFVIYICVEGSLLVNYKGGEAVPLKRGESMLVPAALNEVSLIPIGPSKLIEVYLKS
jgi:mannose-6-phosphate isomerase